MPTKNTLEKFITVSKEIHGDKYDYSLVEYINNKIKIKIICKKHGMFEQRPDMHIGQKQGCPECKKTTLSKLKSFTTEKFLINTKLIHGDKYDYSLSIYTGTDNKIKIICKRHGIFEQTPHNHISQKQGCPICKFEKLANITRLTTESFIKISKEIHSDIYDYSLVKYKGSKDKVEIICKKHGIFKQTPNSHMLGFGCNKCNSSKGEMKILKYLSSNKIDYIHQKIFDGCKYKNKLRFDFYLPKYNIAIEFDGEQHFKPIETFGGVVEFNKTIVKDTIKNIFCENNNINLIRIPYNQIDNIEIILNDILK